MASDIRETSFCMSSYVVTFMLLGHCVVQIDQNEKSRFSDFNIDYFAVVIIIHVNNMNRY